MESILNSVKAVLGISVDDEVFDKELIVHANAALMLLGQLGVGPSDGYSIKTAADKWVDFIGNRHDLEMIKLYTAQRVRLSFDPPANSFLVKAIEEQLKEFEWRIEWNTSKED